MTFRIMLRTDVYYTAIHMIVVIYKHVPKLTTCDEESDTKVAVLLFPLQMPQASVSIPDSSTLSQPTIYV